MLGFLLAGDRVVNHPYILYGLLLMPVWGISSVTAVLSAYAAEVYPTQIRSRGSGLIAAVTKTGGVLVIGLVTLSLTPPSIAGTAFIGAVPMALATVATAILGIETCKRTLEDITTALFDRRVAESAGSS